MASLPVLLVLRYLIIFFDVIELDNGDHAFRLVPRGLPDFCVVFVFVGVGEVVNVEIVVRDVGVEIVVRDVDVEIIVRDGDGDEGGYKFLLVIVGFLAVEREQC